MDVLVFLLVASCNRAVIFRISEIVCCVACDKTPQLDNLMELLSESHAVTTCGLHQKKSARGHGFFPSILVVLPMLPSAQGHHPLTILVRQW